MKESIEEKAKRYDEAIEKFKPIYDLAKKENRTIDVKEFENIFPELKESEDERIRKAIIEHFAGSHSSMYPYKGFTKEQILAWLEAQGNIDSQVKLPTFTFDDVLALQCCMETVKKVQEDKELYEQLQSLHNRLYDAYQFEKQGEQKPIISNDALREGIAHFGITQYQIDNWLKKYVNIEKRDDTKPDDNVEPKFHEGEWINGYYTNYKVLSVNNDGYLVEDTDGNKINILFENEKFHHPWTIQDAKDGDVLEFGDHGRLVVGVVSYVNKATGKVDVNCLLENNNFKVGNYYNLDTIKPHPATKEQRNFLFQKIKEAGYEWNVNKKELRKIEQKPAWSEEDIVAIDCAVEVLSKDLPSLAASIKRLKSLKGRVQLKQEWSEEDEKMLDEMYNFFDTHKIPSLKHDMKDYAKFIKSFKPQNTWKPSDKQIEALDFAADCIVPAEFNFKRKELKGLLEQLKKLRKE